MKFLLDEKIQKVQKFYDEDVLNYVEMYKSDYDGYPANAIRLEMITKRLLENNAKNVIDVGCGTGITMLRLLKEGMKCKGFDFSKEMRKYSQDLLEKEGYDRDLIKSGDIQEKELIFNEKFDSAIALGVFPNVLDDTKCLLNMKQYLNKNGKVYIVFRNDLFSTFTLNKYSIEFFLEKVINFKSIPPQDSEKVRQFYHDVLKEDKKIIREEGKIHDSEILAKFANPLTIEEDLFKPCGFKVDNLLWYHFHGLPPIFEEKNPDLFKKMSLELEDPYSWKGYLMASAFVVEATKID